jgi:hypothetical protein
MAEKLRKIGAQIWEKCNDSIPDPDTTLAECDHLCIYVETWWSNMTTTAPPSTLPSTPTATSPLTTQVATSPSTATLSGTTPSATSVSANNEDSALLLLGLKRNNNAVTPSPDTTPSPATNATAAAKQPGAEASPTPDPLAITPATAKQPGVEASPALSPTAGAPLASKQMGMEVVSPASRKTGEVLKRKVHTHNQMARIISSTQSGGVDASTTTSAGMDQDKNSQEWGLQWLQAPWLGQVQERLFHHCWITSLDPHRQGAQRQAHRLLFGLLFHQSPHLMLKCGVLPRFPLYSPSRYPGNLGNCAEGRICPKIDF